MGELKAVAKANGNWLKELADNVKFQNGRVGELEKWRSFIIGANSVIILCIVPILIYIVSEWFKGKL